MNKIKFYQFLPSEFRVLFILEPETLEKNCLYNWIQSKSGIIYERFQKLDFKGKYLVQRSNFNSYDKPHEFLSNKLANLCL